MAAERGRADAVTELLSDGANIESMDRVRSPEMRRISLRMHMFSSRTSDCVMNSEPDNLGRAVWEKLIREG